MKNKSFPLLMIILVMSLLSSSCNRGNKKTKITTVKVQLPWLFQSQFAGTMVAEEQHFGKAYNIKIRNFQGGLVASENIANVTSGEMQFGITQPDNFIFTRAKGAHIIAICVIFDKSMTAFMVRKNSGIKTPYNFVGKKVGEKKNTNIQLEYLAMLDTLKINVNKIIPVPVQYNLSPFLSKEVDVFPCFSINAPYVAKKYGVDYKLIFPRDYGIHFYGDIIYTTKKMIKKHPEIVRSFLKTVIKGWKYASNTKNEGSVIEAILKKSPLLDPKHQEFMLNACRPLIAINDYSNGEMKKDVWVGMIKILQKYSHTQLRLETNNVDSIFTNKYLPK